MAWAIEVQNLHKDYGGLEGPVLKGLSFNVAQGSFFGLLGPNGAGKTTTIQILCGGMRPDQGKVVVLGQAVSVRKPRPHPRLGLAPQGNALFSPLSLRENLAYLAALYGIPRRVAESRIAELLARLDLSRHGDKRFAWFSGGMKRRGNLAAALIHHPKLLILDEPTAGVDVQSRAMILAYLKELREEGITILYTSHLLSEAQELCDQVLIMDHGCSLDQGRPRELMEKYGQASKLEDVLLSLTGRKPRDD